jgi:iron complex transport system permease protein
VRSAWPSIGALAILLLATLLVALGIGTVGIAPLEVVAILGRQVGLDLPWGGSDMQETVLTSIRLPRVLSAALVGAGWAAAGVAMQGLYRTPLADPALVGVGAGAALGASLGLAVAIALGILATLAGDLVVLAGALVAGLVVVAVIDRVARLDGQVVVPRMLLAGVALTAFFGALTAVVVVGGRNAELGSLAFWGLGSLSAASGRDVLVAAVVVIPATWQLAQLGPALDALALGESQAGHLGVDVRRLTIGLGIILALLTAAAVAVAGVIAFLGLLVPGLLRTWIGSAQRPLAVASALLGATLLVAADALARSLFSPVEIPVGVVTTLLGAPFFLWLLLRDRGLLSA